MKKEYDFSKAEKGRFFRKPDELKIPVYLDKDVVRKLNQRREGKSPGLSAVVNKILRKEIEVAEMPHKRGR